ncbi:hypothetical protein [Lacinutrix jangbogonensis]|uniref:hypothetical protein n=1 Tax=Lacinutrix jangbogonensis TaxID=1469557 RepID=UPI00053F03D5|nr:hypothetical protein [Lacinutrix jangbogonensis]
MNWKFKALLQNMLSLFPLGDKLNHIPATRNKNYHKNVFKYQFLECIRKYKEIKLDYNSKNLTALEIGTGYSLTAPLTLYLLGFKQIITVDITQDVNCKTFKKQFTRDNINKVKSELIENSIYNEEELNHRIDKIQSFNTLNQILNYCNIKYIPGYSIESIDNLNIKFDYLYSQVVFEHIQPNKLKELFSKFPIWLKQDAYSVHTINFIDHFTNPGSFQDKDISEFNFLKYSNKTWQFWAGNSIAYTNRLSYIFYLDLTKENNIKCIDFIGENYKNQKPLKKKDIHKDIINQYKNKDYIKELQKYQRGTLVLKNEKT